MRSSSPKARGYWEDTGALRIEIRRSPRLRRANQLRIAGYRDPRTAFEGLAASTARTRAGSNRAKPLPMHNPLYCMITSRALWQPLQGPAQDTFPETPPRSRINAGAFPSHASAHRPSGVYYAFMLAEGAGYNSGRRGGLWETRRGGEGTVGLEAA